MTYSTISNGGTNNRRTAGRQAPLRVRSFRHADHDGRTRQHGFSLVTTLFLLVVVSSLAAYMVNLASAQHLSSAMASQTSRSLYMAISGLEWVTAEISSNPGNCPPVPSSFQTDGFTITLGACSRYPVTEAGVSYALYDISVEASQGSFGETGYVSRSLRATVME